jgi:DNA polymerase-1
VNSTLFKSIPLSNNCILVEDASELPDLPLTIRELYLDVETSSGHSQLTSLNPWKTEYCKVCLAAFTWDDNPEVYCVPRDVAEKVLPHLLSRTKYWINQNVKYDVHVLHNDLGIDYAGELVDTLTFAKIIDSDRTYRGGYGLDALCLEYLKLDLSTWYKSLSPFLEKNKDYGRVHLPILADYAGNQVRANRLLYKKQLEILPEECEQIWATEQELTKLLVSVERRGMKIDVERTQLTLLRSLHRMMDYGKQLEHLVGYPVNPKSHEDCEDLLLNRFGLPPVYSEKKGVRSKGPSFDKKVLQNYKRLPEAPLEILDLVSKYRHEDTMQGMFWSPWLDLNVDGILHSSYNQNVRSGRMSCKEPNAQFFNDEARELVYPRHGYTLVVRDYSQIEYRLICHYIKNPAAIRAYNEDSNTDFYMFVANEIGIKRKPSKVLCLAKGYGMGKKKTIADLSINEDIIAMTGGDRVLAREIAIKADADFHRRLPELKPETYAAERAARMNGYVRNAHGRRCHIPLQFARVAFNRVCQSHAADHIKDRAVALWKEQPKYGAEMLAMVHDEILDEVPDEIAEQYGLETNSLLNYSRVPLRVPIKCDMGLSKDNWYDSKQDADRRKKRDQQNAVKSA